MVPPPTTPTSRATPSQARQCTRASTRSRSQTAFTPGSSPAPAGPARWQPHPRCPYLHPRRALTDGLRPGCLDVEPNRRLPRVPVSSFGPSDAEARGLARIDQLVELEQGRDDRHGLVEKLVMFQLAAAFV